MRIYLLLLALLMMVSTAWAGGTFTVTEAEYIVVSGNTSDTLGRTMITPDSMRIVVSDSAGTELHDAWYESADAQCALNGDVITFFDQWEDINGAASIGIFSLVVTIASDAQGNIDVFSNQNYVIQGVSQTVTATFAEVGMILDTLQNQDNWVAQQSTVDTIKDTLYNTIDVNVASIDNNAITAASINNGAIDAATLTEPTYAKIADSVWDEILTGATHNEATSAGRRLRQIDAAFTLATGQAQVSGTPADAGTYIILAAATSEADDFFNHATITIDGGTGVGQSRSIDDYTGATDSAALHPGDDWITDPDATSTYVISPGNPVEVVNYHGDNALDQIWEYDTANISGAQAVGTMVKDTSAYQAEISVPSDTNINGDTVAVIGNDQAMRLQSLVVSNSAGDAVQFTSTGSNGDGFQVTGDGAGYGLVGMGDPSGGTGFGIAGIGGQTSGEGLYVYSYSGDAAEFIANAGNGNGIKLIAQGSGVEITHDDLVDATWDEDTTGHWTPPNMAFIASQTAAGFTLDQIWEYDTANISGAQAVGTMLKDTSAYQGAAGALDSTAVYGAVEQLAADSGIVTYSHGVDSTLLLKKVTITGANGANVGDASFFVQNTSGDAVHFRGVVGHGLRLQGASNGSALQATASSGATAVQFTSTGVDGSSEPGEDFRIDSAVMTIITGTLDTVNYVKAGGFGRGSRTITHLLIDTAGTDTAVAGVKVAVKYLSGKRYIELSTNSSGEIIFSATENDTLLYYIYSQPWHIFPNGGGGDSTFVTTGADITDSSWGYDFEIASPSGDSICRIYAYAYDANGDSLKGAYLTAILKKSNVEDTCNNVIIAKRLERGTISSVTGYTYIDLIWSSCLHHPSGDTVKYKVKMMYNGIEQWKKDNFVVPDSATHRITREE